jgi:hypothetical protein
MSNASGLSSVISQPGAAFCVHVPILETTVATHIIVNAMSNELKIELSDDCDGLACRLGSVVAIKEAEPTLAFRHGVGLQHAVQCRSWLYSRFAPDGRAAILRKFLLPIYFLFRGEGAAGPSHWRTNPGEAEKLDQRTSAQIA